MNYKEKTLLALSILILIPISITTLYIPQIISKFLDEYDTNYVILLGAAIALLILLRIANKALTVEYGFSITKRLKVNFYESLIYKRFEINKIGYYIDIYDRDFSIVEKFFSVDYINIFNNLIIIIGVLIIFANTSILLAIGSLIFLITSFCILYLYVWKSNNSIVSDTRTVEEEYKNFVLEMFKLSYEINSAKKNNKVLSVVGEHLAKIKECNIKLHRYLYRLWIIVLLMYNFTLTITLLTALGLVSAKQIDGNDFFVIFMYTLMLKSPLEHIQSNIQAYIKFLESNKRINAIINQGVAKENTERVVIKKISLSNISKTAINKCILDNISITLSSGVYCFFGESGSGKSTIGKIISGVISEYTGKVSVNNNTLVNADFLLNNSAYLEKHSLNEDIFEKLDITKVLLDDNKSLIVIDELFSNLSKTQITKLVTNIRKLASTKIVVIISHHSYFTEVVDKTFYFNGGEINESKS